MSVVMGGPSPWTLSAEIPQKSLGSWMRDGYLICKNLGVALVAAPACTELGSSFASDRFNVVNCAIKCTVNPAGPGGWFLPTAAQLQVGYNCRQYWDWFLFVIGPGNCFSSYWASDCPCSGYACYFDFVNGNAGISNGQLFARAFRCVTY